LSKNFSIFQSRISWSILYESTTPPRYAIGISIILLLLLLLLAAVVVVVVAVVVLMVVVVA